MKLSKFQIIVLLLVVWFYTNSRGGGLIPTPFVPQLEAADLEAKVLAAMVVLADDHKPAPALPTVAKEVVPETPKPIEDEVLPEQTSIEEAELFPGRYPRAIILTNTVSCPPCRDYDRTTVNIFRTKTWQDSGWSIGSEATNVIEIVDLSKEEDKFYDYFEKLSSVRKDISPSTPTTVFINVDGSVKDVRIGKILHNEFVKLAKPEAAKASSLDVMSHKEMVKLHNEFHGGGNWKWPGDLKSHLATTHGVK
jgi:hypothetical protein